MIKKILYLTFISILYSTNLFSQSPPYYHYTPSNGLASATVYDIVQDKDGFIWMATLNGLNRFDGKRFITYTINDGLNSNSITSLLAGDKGELYIGNHDKGINILRNGKIENFRNNYRGSPFSLNYLLELKESIYGSAPFGGIIDFKKNNKSGDDDSLIFPNQITPKTFLNRVVKTADNKLIALTTRGLFIFENGSLVKLNTQGLTEEKFYSASLDKDSTILLGGEGIICRIKNKKMIASLPVNIFDNSIVYNLFIDSHRNIWFSISGKGFYVIPAGSVEINDVGKKIGLENTQIDKFFEDDEGNMWIATFGKGVYCLTNLYIQNYSENDGLVNNNVNCILKDNSGKLLLGTINGIGILENGMIKQLKYNSGEAITGYINNFLNSQNYVNVSLTSDEPKSELVFYKGSNFRLFRRQSFLETSGGLFLFGSVGNNISIQKEFNYKHILRWFYVIGDSGYLNRINHIVEDSEKNIWIGSNSGLCKLSFQKNNNDIRSWEKTFFFTDPVLNSRINSIYQPNKNIIWFAASKGIASYNLLSKTVTNYTNILGHDLSSSTSIAIDKKDRIWIGTMNGVYVFDGKSIKHINSQTGLPSNEILSLFYDNQINKLYIGSSNGFSELDINLFDNHSYSIPKIRINNFTAGNTLYTDYKNLVFERNQNNVGIDISAVNFSSPSTIKYRYKLKDSWIDSEIHYLNFSSLEYGKYNLQISARTQNSDWSKPYYLSFEILPRFTETLWFYLLMFLILICLHLLLIFWRIKKHKNKIRQELELSERINELKHQALSAMMNPHFIFNSLNSVQYLINSNRNEEANDYIAMMAKLIRKNLDTAGNGFILLSEEINRLKLYLDLEKLRFQESFSYEIIIGADVDTSSIMIPNMIIQPFVENTLWHGIINTGIRGLITISFSFEDVDVDSIICKSLIIKVTDNGIGINNARKNKKEDHISKGIEIIEERLRLLSTKMQLPKPIMFEDLSSRNDNSHGTEVIISLPQPLYKNTSQE